MAKLSEGTILAHAREITGSDLEPQRAAQLANILNELLENLDVAVSGIAFESEPAQFSQLLETIS